MLSNIHEPMPRGTPFAEREGLVFIGGFAHPPNTDAVLWYAQEILPRVREALPGVHDLHRRQQGAGAAQGARRRGLHHHRLRARRRAVLPGCRVSIAPLRYGAGVKGKVNLAMSYGLPVVATTPSIEGMHLADGEDVLSPTIRRRSPTRSARSTGTRCCGPGSPRAGATTSARHFSRDVARSAITRLIALARGSGVPTVD